MLFVERKKREDHAPVKRVELHLHTKLSSMDAFCDPGGIVRLAHRMGHPAIAITDHGVCQGYPEAMLAADDIHKSDPNFKLIYGCEAYFVDDMIPCVYGAVSYTHLRAHETDSYLVCRLLLEKKKKDRHKARDAHYGTTEITS